MKATGNTSKMSSEFSLRRQSKDLLAFERRQPAGRISVSQKETILVIEDDPDIQELVQYNLEREGYQVYVCSDGEIGIQQAEKMTPDLILLDLMLPGLDGLSVCKKIRQTVATKDIPVIMLTAKSEESDVVIGLELGADDYVTKPFSPKELVARLKAILRRTTPSIAESIPEDVLTVGPLSLDLSRHEAYCRGHCLKLTLAEFRLLSMLLSKPGRVYTREQLLREVSGEDTYVIDRNIDVHVRSIRRKLAEDSDMVATVRGVGYKCQEISV